VRYWGVGNENWGCGGRMTPEEYAAHYRRFATYLLPRGGIGETRTYLIACGPNRNDVDWTRRFFDSMQRQTGMVHGYAMHFYSNGKSPATKFTVETLREQLSSFAEMERAILQQNALLRSYDPGNRIGLLIDEWGVWDRIQPEDEKRYGRLWQQNTIRSAVAAALGLNVFHRQADKLVMCNLAQTVNVLHALLLTEGARTIRTPSYHAFELLKPHRAKTALRVDNEDKADLGLSVSASRQGKEMAISLVNPLHDEGMEVSCVLSGGAASGATARILHHSDFNACNTFDAPDAITPKAHSVTAAQGGLRIELPPLSVVTVSAQLA